MNVLNYNEYIIIIEIIYYNYRKYIIIIKNNYKEYYYNYKEYIELIIHKMF